ncbi:MAG: ATPase, T2SS/T4P/T4SS family [Coprobacillus sp.]
MEEIFEKMIYRALTRKATDIHMILKEELMIKFRVFGNLIKYDHLDNDLGPKLMNYIKYKSMINMNYKLLPQTGDFTINISQKEYYLRISYLPTLDFESIVIRILNNHEPLTIDELTQLKDIKDYLYWLTQQSSGLFLISGATGSGKSTTLYTLLDEISQMENKNIITIEDPIEMHKEKCLQIELNEKLGITYHQTLRQILRHDPDVIMIGEIRDEDTAKIAVTCALTGHLVLTTIHASNAILSLKRLINLGIDKVDLSDLVIGAMSQRMKYDAKRKEVIVLSEVLTKKQVKEYLENNDVKYDGFLHQAKKLIEMGYDKELFVGEFNE